MINMANRNTLYASVFVDALAQLGLKHAVIGAGSRSTPLTLAFVEHEQIETYSFIDERSAGFFGLGLARASNEPVALVCTSGTAGANFFPAVIEANYSEVPLLVLTTDRPPELRESGSNQTIDQIKIFGNHVRWFHDMGLPEAKASRQQLRYVQSIAMRAIQTSQYPIPGAIHLNFPFRKPLEPTVVEGDVLEDIKVNALPIVPDYEISTPYLEDIERINRALDGVSRGMILCGPRSEHIASESVVLAKRLGFVLIADGLSGARFSVPKDYDFVLTHYESYIQTLPSAPPQLVIRIGDMPTSKQLNAYIRQLPEETHVMHISENGRWHDDQFRTDEILWTHFEALFNQLMANAKAGTPDEGWVQTFIDAEGITKNTALEHLDQLEARVLVDTAEALPENSLLYVANSLPVRHMDQFVSASEKMLTVFANRGASGIDGQVSSALGAAAVWNAPVVLVTGDLSFLHDLGGLLAVKRLGIKLVIVVINNDGGAIFQRLPIKNFEPVFTDYFSTPHGLTFKKAAEMFGLNYVQAETRDDFRREFDAALAAEDSSVIEVPSDGAMEEVNRQAFLDTVQDKIKNMEIPESR